MTPKKLSDIKSSCCAFALSLSLFFFLAEHRHREGCRRDVGLGDRAGAPRLSDRDDREGRLAVDLRAKDSRGVRGFVYLS